jgi:amidophosphoribosyltransferase
MGEGWGEGEDKLRDECGIVGIFGHERATELAYLGLFSLQHRGEESAGIVVCDKGELVCHKGMGLVDDVFDDTILKSLPGHAAIGHVRYSTTGTSNIKNAQPILVDYSRGQIAVAHNGNLINAKYLRDELEAHGLIFSSTVDSEIFIHLLAHPKYRNQTESILGAIRKVQGAFSLVILTGDSLIGLRDPHGFRPLCIGKIGSAYVLASETCALNLIGAEYIRDVEPGEVVIINSHGLRSEFPFKEEKHIVSQCIFEHVYFARPDSKVFGESVALVRERLGAELAKLYPVDADMVIPVPDSGNFAAIGYAKHSKIPYRAGFTRNHYIGRTFISPIQSKRSFRVRIKLSPVREVIEGQRVVVVDDSIVRGNTARTRVHALREAGAKEVHLRISCPPHISPCYYGIDFPDKKELIAVNHSLKEIERFLEVDSLGYLTVDALLGAVKAHPKTSYCVSCFTDKHPVAPEGGFNKFSLERNRL